jgi:8-oxo-dGTP diphosphatase
MTEESASRRPHYRVVAALIERNGAFLITQRPPWARLPLLWEFPGGRVEPDESDEQALAREMREILDVRVTVGPRILNVRHAYALYDLDFLVFRCEIADGEPKPVRVQELRWVRSEDLPRYTFPGADQKTVDCLLERD